MMPDLKPTVHEAWLAVMQAVQAIGKKERNEAQRFNFRGIDAVVNAVGPQLREAGVYVVPSWIVDMREERYATSNDKAMHGVTLTIEWRITGPRGDDFTAVTVGEAADAGDKAVSKAHSVAYRTLFLQGLCIPTDEPDPDSEAHERSNKIADADPRAKKLQEIIDRGKELKLTPPEINADYAAKFGHAINSTDATLESITAYLAGMGQPPTEKPKP